MGLDLLLEKISRTQWVLSIITLEALFDQPVHLFKINIRYPSIADPSSFRNIGTRPNGQISDIGSFDLSRNLLLLLKAKDIAKVKCLRDI